MSTFAAMEEKRQNIISKSFELFQRYGIKSVSMDDIAREMGMSKKTLYQVISDKSELVEDVVRFMKDEMTQFLSIFHNASLTAIEQHLAQRDAAKNSFRHCNPTLSYDLRKYYPMYYQQLNDSFKQAIYEAHLANLVKGKKEGHYRPELNAELIARVMVVHHTYTFDPTNEVFESEELNNFNTIEELYNYHLRGICTNKGLQELQRLISNSNE